MIFVVIMILLCMADAPYILPAVTGFLPFYALATFFQVWLSFQTIHWFVNFHHHLPVLVMPHPITKQRILFCLLVHHGIPIWNKVGILSHYPSWHAPSGSIFPSFGWYVIPAGHIPQRSLSRNPRIGSPFSPLPNHILSYL